MTDSEQQYMDEEPEFLAENDEVLDGMVPEYEHFRCIVDAGQVPIRIDKYLFERMVHSSRNRIQTAAEAGCIRVNDRPVKSNYKVRHGDIITLMLSMPKHDSTIYPEDIPLNIVYEDEELMVVNKQAGLAAWWCIRAAATSAVHW